MSTQKPGSRFTQGVHHVGLTVDSLDAAVSFFTETLGFERVGGRPEYPSVFVSDGAVMLTLWQAQAPSVAFDRKHCVGLHHVALRVADHDALAAVHDRLRACEGVSVEFAPEALGQGPAQHMMCMVPGGVRVEFFSPGA
ncbi:VOC family protein [Haliangium ochraceum]|nr:VOC family protein [Haliangium ochraceum]